MVLQNTGNLKTTGALTLDNYETGSFTPALEFGGASVGITYSSQDGLFVRIGDMVQFTLYIHLTSKGTSVGTASVTTLPFTCAFGAIASIEWGVIDLTANYTACTAFINGGTNTILMSEAGDNVVLSSLTNAQFANNSKINITGSYRITS